MDFSNDNDNIGGCIGGGRIMVCQVADKGLYSRTREFARLLCSVKRSTEGRGVSRCRVDNGAGVSVLQGHGAGGFL